ncbi:MAG: UDP-N-acetylglucosamine 2-epimerase (non-hydrolyzing) [Clostridiales bacterium]|jgi:UDP-N-acetylglucosamine 2-epimerase (non-hydrolysing)|nr:UDP-N-acetylglucosamine 2-epimerase (non-hydrolyzing) [Clostridiales bacterium]
MGKVKILSIFGTRPEAIKMAPLVQALANCPHIASQICVTAQHRRMLDQVLDIFGIWPDFDLNIMVQNQDLAHITTAALNGLIDVIGRARPDLILVHGDTTTTMAASLAAYYTRVKLGHVEAGLRTFDKFAPYPEEANRKITATLADLHFAPTRVARSNLITENVIPENIYVTGNTAIDAIDSLVAKDYIFKEPRLNGIDFANKRIIAMTAHRRENYGRPMENICHAAAKLAADFDDIEVVWPVHLSPAVSDIAHRILGNNNKIHLIRPTDVADLLNLIDRSYFVMTDSGGIQEEAPHLDKPVLVLREVTERPEGLETGCLALAGTEEKEIYDMAARLLTDAREYGRMAAAKNPFGDGAASRRIHQAILYHFGLENSPPEDFV